MSASSVMVLLCTGHKIRQIVQILDLSSKKLLWRSLTKSLEKTNHCLLMCLKLNNVLTCLENASVPMPHYAQHVLMHIILSQGSRLYHKVGVELSVHAELDDVGPQVGVRIPLHGIGRRHSCCYRLFRWKRRAELLSYISFHNVTTLFFIAWR